MDDTGIMEIKSQDKSIMGMISKKRNHGKYTSRQMHDGNDLKGRGIMGNISPTKTIMGNILKEGDS